MSKQTKQTSIGQWLVAAVVIVAVAAGGYLVWRKAMQAKAPAPAVAPATVSTAPAPQPTVQHPISQAGPAEAASAPLPALDASDGVVAEALANLAASGDLRSLLLSDQIIRRIVATVDTLPRRELGTRMLPVRTPKGMFITEQADGITVIGAKNAERYAPYMQIVEHADPQALVAWYVRSYPLFQQAYQDLGYPKGYFNDRLIQAIDNMLAAPDPAGPVALVRPKVLYLYADPKLQSLSAGQRLLIRVGPANEAQIKAKLRAIRAALTGAKLPPATASTAAAAN